MKGSSWIVPYNNANTIRWFQTLRRFAWTAYLKFLEILSEYVSLLRDTIYVLSGDAKSEPNRNFPYSLNYENYPYDTSRALSISHGTKGPFHNPCSTVSRTQDAVPGSMPCSFQEHEYAVQEIDSANWQFPRHKKADGRGLPVHFSVPGRNRISHGLPGSSIRSRDISISCPN